MLKRITRTETIILKGLHAAETLRAAHWENDLWVTADRILDAAEQLGIDPEATQAALTSLEDRAVIVQRDTRPLAYALTRTGEVLAGMVEANDGDLL